MTEDLRLDHLRGIVMRAPGITATTSFYTEQWGLHVAQAEDGITYLRGTGEQPFIYGLKDDATYGIEYIHFGMPDRAGVDGLYRQLDARGADLRGAPGAFDGPFGGYGFEVADPDNRRLRITADVPLRGADVVHAYPRKISHVVLNTPDMEGGQRWYEEMLGFRPSDYSADQMVFLRIGSDHHAIALVRAQYPSVNHVAFEMPGIDSFMRGIGRMKQKGQVPSWGPGRHGPGNNLFAMVRDPDGNRLEFSAELEVFADDDPTRTWPHEEYTLNLWGSAWMRS